jgi:hypothetical protein
MQYTERPNAECPYAECIDVEFCLAVLHYSGWHYAVQYRYKECHSAECCFTKRVTETISPFTENK